MASGNVFRQLAVLTFLNFSILFFKFFLIFFGFIFNISPVALAALPRRALKAHACAALVARPGKRRACGATIHRFGLERSGSVDPRCGRPSVDRFDG